MTFRLYVFSAGGRAASPTHAAEACLCPVDAEAYESEQDEEHDDDDRYDDVALHGGGSGRSCCVLEA